MWRYVLYAGRDLWKPALGRNVFLPVLPYYKFNKNEKEMDVKV
jgi:hypothetical protein